MSWRSDIKAMVHHKCAECHQGDMFPTHSFSFNHPFEMHERCPKCDANFEPEPGFYYGAMFVSYILSSFLFLGMAMLLHWVIGLSLEASFGILIAFGLFIFVWWFRFARAFWLNLMVKYRPEKGRLASQKR